MIELPPLRPLSHHMAYVHELRAIMRAIEEPLRIDMARAQIPDNKVTVAKIAYLALKYRLKLGAMFEILEEFDLLACGTHDRVKRSRMTYSDGSEGRFAPMRIFREVIAQHGLPDAAPGCEVPV